MGKFYSLKQRIIYLAFANTYKRKVLSNTFLSARIIMGAHSSCFIVYCPFKFLSTCMTMQKVIDSFGCRFLSTVQKSLVNLILAHSLHIVYPCSQMPALHFFLYCFFIFLSAVCCLPPVLLTSIVHHVRVYTRGFLKDD